MSHGLKHCFHLPSDLPAIFTFGIWFQWWLYLDLQRFPVDLGSGHVGSRPVLEGVIGGVRRLNTCTSVQEHEHLGDWTIHRHARDLHVINARIKGPVLCKRRIARMQRCQYFICWHHFKLTDTNLVFGPVLRHKESTKSTRFLLPSVCHLTKIHGASVSAKKSLEGGTKHKAVGTRTLNLRFFKFYYVICAMLTALQAELYFWFSFRHCSSCSRFCDKEGRAGCQTLKDLCFKSHSLLVCCRFPGKDS